MARHRAPLTFDVWMTKYFSDFCCIRASCAKWLKELFVVKELVLNPDKDPHVLSYRLAYTMLPEIKRQYKAATGDDFILFHQPETAVPSTFGPIINKVIAETLPDTGITYIGSPHSGRHDLKVAA